MTRIPLPLRTYSDVVPDGTRERIVNLFPQKLPSNSREGFALIGTPGLKPLGTFGANVRGALPMDGTLYVVAGQKLYSMGAGGSETEIGDIPGTDRVIMATSGAELAIAANGDGYVYDGSTITNVISDVTSVTWQDGYFLWSNTSDQFQWSNVNDGKTYDALDFATHEGDPDGIVVLLSDHRQLLIFGEKTVEVWRNTGGSPPWTRANEVFIQTGCAAKHSVKRFDNSVVWVDDKFHVVVFAGSGYQVISTPAISDALRKANGDCEACTYNFYDEEFYALFIPGQGTFTYGARSGEWFEQKSYQQTGWRVRFVENVYGKQVALGETKAWELDPDTYDEDGDALIRKAVLPYIHSENRVVRHDRLEVLFKRGVGLATGQGSNPQAMMRYSNDGRNWSNEIWREIGDKGEYEKRAFWNRLGSARQRTYEISVSDPVEVQMVGAFLEAGLGS